jgi:8-oxo-dGTP pyrophosphatase MutT (NUDIX family)
VTERPAWLQPVEGVLLSGADLFREMPAPPSDARSSAVLMLFGDGPDVLLTERSSDLRSHPGQLSFPGGSADPDDFGPVDTALREAHEEVGLDPADVEVLGSLPPLWLPPSNFAVTPVLGWWRRPVPLTSVDTSEVASVLRVPLATLVDPRHRFTARHPLGYRGPAFELADGLVLWGFTAGVVSRLLDAAGWAQPWDATAERPLPVSGGARR